MAHVVFHGSILIYFLNLPVLVGRHSQANTAGYLNAIEDTFRDFPRLKDICIACATYCTNIMTTREGFRSSQQRPKKRPCGGSQVPTLS